MQSSLYNTAILTRTRKAHEVVAARFHPGAKDQHDMLVGHLLIVSKRYLKTLTRFK